MVFAPPAALILALNILALRMGRCVTAADGGPADGSPVDGRSTAGDVAADGRADGASFNVLGDGAEASASAPSSPIPCTLGCSHLNPDGRARTPPPAKDGPYEFGF